ncbi:MAG: OmpA family protein [Patescibacteria group bacterium]
MGVNIKKKGWAIIAVASVLAIGGGAMWMKNSHPEWLQREQGVASAVPQGTRLPGMVTAAETTVVEEPVYALSRVASEHAGTLRVRGIAWNGQMSAIYANGGVNTAPGSLMARHGVSVNYGRQDMYPALTAELVSFAQEMRDGTADPTSGAHFVVIMGDAGGSFLYGVQDALNRAGLSDYHPKVVFASGFSRGEDKCMGPPEWARDPQKAKGGLIAAVIRDGDWNLCVAWAEANGIKVNPDIHTYDPEALNFLGTDDFIQADNAYIAGAIGTPAGTYMDGPHQGQPHGVCENRPYAPGTGIGTKEVCVRGVGTWTPGDSAVVEGKGGLVGLLSTRENASQMAATFITIDEWAVANRATVTNFAQAIFTAGTQIQTDRAKLRSAADMSARVWNEQDGAYWFRMYTGYQMPDPISGEMVRLGGSQAIGLASNVQYFLPGRNGGRSIYQTVYDSFCRIYTTFYPREVPSCPANPVNTSFIEAIAAKVPNMGQGSILSTFTGAEDRVVASANYSNITFEVGSARIRPESTPVLNGILEQLTVGSNLAVRIEGYTSSDGNAADNQRLSEARAAAVREWLRSHASEGVISDTRVTFAGHGSSELVRDAAGRENASASRRVKISLVSGE